MYKIKHASLLNFHLRMSFSALPSEFSGHLEDVVGPCWTLFQVHNCWNFKLLYSFSLCWSYIKSEFVVSNRKDKIKQRIRSTQTFSASESRLWVVDLLSSSDYC